MSIALKHALPALLLVALTVQAAEFCKWVDENGVVHYAETCPENAESALVPIEPPPPQEQVQATADRAERLQSERRARRAEQAQQKARQALDSQELEQTADAMNRRCAEARWNLGILRKQLPVYYDEENQLHYNRSLHDDWYEGQRTYLDDQQRAAEIDKFAAVEAQACTGSEADIRERITMYMEKRDSEICQHLRIRLANMKQLSTGIPSSEMRELEETIATHCR